MVKNILTLIRWKNLLITGGLIYALKYLVFESAIDYLFPLSSSQFSFTQTTLLIFSLIFLAAAGYIINDIHDIKTDHINKPEKVIIDVVISKKLGDNLYLLLNAIGIGLGVYLGYQLGNYQIGLLHGIVAAIFWIYSTQLKGTVLIGNLLIAIASSSVPLIYFGFEGYTYIIEYGPILEENYKARIGGPNAVLFYFCLILSVFAFLLSLAREIVKDIEDQKGDFATGLRTLPIVWGETIAKRISQFTILVCAGLVIWILNLGINQLPFTATFFHIYCYSTIVAPCFYLVYQINSAQSKTDYHTSSSIIKLIMVSGILTTVIYASSI